MAKVVILDVGHGNCAVVSDSGGHVVIDGGANQTLLQYLHSEDIRAVDDVLISHADSDHIGGLIEVFLDPEIEVRRVFMNQDALRRTGLWNDFRTALAPQVRSGRTELHTELTSVVTGMLSREDYLLQVLSPSPVTATVGAGGIDIDGELNTLHSMSAVIRIVARTSPEVLLAGDIDQLGLNRLLAEGTELSARVLVFPHHGGLPGSADAVAFVSSICRAVQPQLIVFSVGRGKHGNPRPEIVAAVREVLVGVPMICTQLSETCVSAVPASEPAYLADTVAQGREQRKCCGGTLEIELGGGDLACRPSLQEHAGFVEVCVPSALCRKAWD